MMRLATILCGLCAALTLGIAEARAEKRVALVIGNGAYQNASPLAAPARDATAVAELFRKAGFDLVETKFDLGNLDLKTVARDFTAAARDADVAIVYFAGLGIEVNGTNYLVPVDAKLASDFDVEDEALSLDRLMRTIEPAKRARLVILDASRDNAFARTMKRAVSAGKATAGLAKVEPASGTLIAFATSPGTTIEDGPEQGAFTAALLKSLMVPGRDLRTALNDVRDQVRQVTANRQEPFVAGTPGTAVASAVDPAKPEAPTRQISVLPNPQAPQQQAPQQFVADPQRDYEAAERIGTKEAWDAFLSVHPAGFYASLARTQRDKLVAPAAPVATLQPAEQQVALLPSPTDTPQDLTLDPRGVARELQAELKRVGCDPGATDGNWSPRSRDALGQFNRRAGMDFDTSGPSVSALEAVRGQRGRICALTCGSGQRAEGDRCVAIPAAPPPAKQAARPPERPRKAEPPAKKAPARETARRERPERIRAPTDREIFGGGGGRPAAAPPISIGIGRGGGVGIGFGF